MLLTRGLGATPYVPKSSQASATPYVPQASSSNVDTVNAKTRGEILAMTQAYMSKARSMVDATRARLVAAQAAGQLGACPTRKTLYAQWDCSGIGNETDNQRDMRVKDQQLIEPIGVVTMLGIAVPLMALKKGNPTLPDEITAEFEIAPNADQQFVIDRALYVRSQIIIASVLYGVDLSERANINELLADPSDASGLVGLFTRAARLPKIAGSTVQSVLPNPSLRQLIGLYKAADGGAWLTPHVDGYSLNPPVPHTSELNNAGGALAYYRRGGFLLVRDAFLGRTPIERSLMFTNLGVCVSACDGVPQPVVQRQIIGTSLGWLGFATKTPGGYKIRIQAKEAGTVSKVAGVIAGVLKGVAGVACSAAPMVVGYNTGLLTEACINTKTKKTCKKGETDCVCTGPSLTQAAMVGVGNAALTHICGGINAAPTTALPPPPALPEANNTWLWIAGGLAVFGGLMYVARR